MRLPVTLDNGAPVETARPPNSGALAFGQQRRMRARESGHCRRRPLARSRALLSSCCPRWRARARCGGGAPARRARSAYSSCSGSGVSSQPMYTGATAGSRARCATAAAASSMWMRLAQCGARRARRPAQAQPLDQLQPARAIQAGQSQRRGGFGSAASNASASSRMRPLKPCGAGGVSRRPSRPVLRDGAGRHEHDALQMGGVQRGEHIAQPVDEHAAIDGFVARAGAGRKIRRVTARRAGRDAVGPRDVAQPGDAVRVVSGRLAPQGMDLRPGPAAAARRRQSPQPMSSARARPCSHAAVDGPSPPCGATQTMFWVGS